MTIRGRVTGNRTIELANGARLKFSATDCAETLRAGDAVIVDTEAFPSVRKQAKQIYNPVTESKA